MQNPLAPRKVTCVTEGCEFDGQEWTIEPIPYMQKLWSYSTHEFNLPDNNFIHSVAQPQMVEISTGLHTWPELFCNGCGCRPALINKPMEG